MTRILFWNVNKKDLRSLLCPMAKATAASVVVLCEDDVASSETLASLQSHVSVDFQIPPTIGGDNRFQCFSRNALLDLEEVHKGFRTSTRRLQFQNRTALLGLVHGVDMRNHDSESRQAAAQDMSNEFRFAIERQKNTQMIIIGDFNMNPFDRPMNLAAGMNAMMTRTCAERGTRTYLQKPYDFYYNPMWSLFGDEASGPSGTVYDTSNQGPYGWSMLDQVLVHHSAITLFRNVTILTMSGTTSLADNHGHPDKVSASDHFPILVEFEST